MRFLLSYLIFSYSLFGFNLESCISDSSSISVFNDVCFAQKGDGLRFVLNSHKDETVTVKYFEDDIFVNSFEIKLLSNTTHFIPSKSKSIILSGDSGKYTFEFSSGNTNKSVSVLIESLRNRFNFSNLNTDNVIEASSNKKPFFKKRVVVYSPSIKLLRAKNQKYFQNPIPYKEEITRATASELYKSIAPSVVMITTEDGSGSGTIIDDKGTILTNYHVIEDKDVVNVYFKPEKFTDASLKEAHLADVIKYDISKDLALIRLRKVNSDLVPIDFVNFNDIEVAQKVHAIGHPHGEQWSYTQGFVSQIRKNYKWTGGRYENMADVIQTQTPINPGNSGGPLISDDGKIVGVNSFLDPTGQGLNYAVAISSVKSFLRDKNKFRQSKEIKDGSNDDDFEGEILDLDEDGVAESIGYDTNQDGEIDIILTDYVEDLDDFFTALMDTNYNGVLDRTRKVKSHEGKYYWVTFVDLDEDGKDDIYEFDFDMDGKVDKRILADEE